MSKEEGVKFNPKVEKVIDEIFSKTAEIDPLGGKTNFMASNFSTKEYIAKIFPSENSLRNIETVLVVVKKQIDNVENELHKGIRDQSLTEHETETINLENSKNTINSLFQKIEEIQKKANESEELVESITKDIKKLDDGKRNLQNSISSLTKLKMFNSSINKLRDLIKDKKYKKIAEQFQAVNSFISFFKDYVQLEIIEKLFKNVLELKQFISQTIGKNFKAYLKHLRSVQKELKQDPQAEDLQTKKKKIFLKLNHICLVIDSISEKQIMEIEKLTNSITSEIVSNELPLRDQIIQDFVDSELSNYKQQSRSLGLDKVGKRFKFIRRLLQKNKDAYSAIFPAHWCLQQQLIAQFSVYTGSEIQKQLTDSEFTDPKILINAIKLSIHFEREMKRNYSTRNLFELETQIKRNKEKLKQLEDEKMQIQRSKRVSSVYQIYSKIKQLREETEELEKKLAKASGGQKKRHEYNVSINFLRLISRVFEPHMSKYINFENEMMEEKITKIVKNETWDPLESHCGENLFIFLEESLKNCITFTKGKTLFELYSKVWKTHILTFIRKLEESLPSVVKSSSKNIKQLFSNTGKTGNFKELSSKDLLKIVQVINICVYCRQELPSFQKVLVSNIHEEYVKEINFRDEIGKFYGLEKTGYKILSKNIFNILSDQFLVMQKIKWDQWTKLATDANSFILKSYELIQNNIIIYANHLPWESFKFFANSFVIHMSNEFETQIFKCKKISNRGCDQFLLDIASFIDYLKNVITLHKEFEENDDYQSIFQKKINDSFRNIQSIFKVIQSSSSSKEFIKCYKSLFPKEIRSKEHYEKIIELKQFDGEKRREEENSFMSKLLKGRKKK